LYFLKTSETNSSKLIANRAPPVMEVISSAKNLAVVALRHQRLADVIDLLRLLRLATAHREDHIAVDASLDAVAKVTLVPHKTRFLGMLQIVAVALVDLPIDRLLDPDNLIHQLVTMDPHHFERELVLIVDDPDENEPITLDRFQG